MARVKVTVLSDSSGPSLVSALLRAFAASARLSAKDGRRVRAVIEQLFGFTRDRAYPGDAFGEIEVTLETGDAVVHAAIHDWGLPVPSAGGNLFGPLPEALAALSSDTRNVLLLNLGTDGMQLAADVPVESTDEAGARHHHADAGSRRLPEEGSEAIEVRAATPADAEAIAQLLYENYHLSYVHGDFYRPRYLMAEFNSGRLHSTIAVHEGKLIGHHALMALPDAPSAETGAAVVHSAYRGLGIFNRLFENTLEEARRRGLSSVFGDAVTIHPFSQRAELSHGYREVALQLGMFPASTTMRGFGGDGPRRRTATLRSYRRFDERPRQVALPDRYRELLESVYANVGLATEQRAASRTPETQIVTTEVDEPRALGFVRVVSWGPKAHAELAQAVRRVLRRHVDVVYADLDLTCVDDPDEATVALNDLGFFAAGLLLHGDDGHDHLRLQRLNSDEIELEELVCDSPFAQALKQRVLDDRARVGG